MQSKTKTNSNNKEINQESKMKESIKPTKEYEEYLKSPIYKKMTDRLDILIGISTTIEGIKPRQAMMFSAKVEIMKNHILSTNFKGIERDFCEKVKVLQSIPEKEINEYLSVSLKELEKLDEEYAEKIKKYGDGGTIPLKEPLVTYRYIENLVMTVDILALLYKNQKDIQKGMHKENLN